MTSQVVITEESHDFGFQRRPMARWADDGSVAKRGGKGGTFIRTLPLKQIEADIALIMASCTDAGSKRTRSSRDVKPIREPARRVKLESNPEVPPSSSPSDSAPNDKSGDKSDGS